MIERTHFPAKLSSRRKIKEYKKKNKEKKEEEEEAEIALLCQFRLKLYFILGDSNSQHFLLLVHFFDFSPLN